MCDNENKNKNTNLKKYGVRIIGREEELLEIGKNKGKNKDIEYKIIVIGDNLTGKTSFCNRFALNKFDLEEQPSTEINCYVKTIILFEKEIKIFLLDIETVPISPLDEEEEEEIYKDINGIIVLYDITQYESFEQIEKLVNKAKKKSDLKNNNNIKIFLIGNKNDLKFLRNIDFAEAKGKAAKLGYELKEINCNKDEEGVNNIMKLMISKIYFNNLNKEEKEKIRNKAKEYLEKK